MDLLRALFPHQKVKAVVDWVMRSNASEVSPELVECGVSSSRHFQGATGPFPTIWIYRTPCNAPIFFIGGYPIQFLALFDPYGAHREFVNDIGSTFNVPLGKDAIPSPYACACVDEFTKSRCPVESIALPCAIGS